LVASLGVVVEEVLDLYRKEVRGRNFASDWNFSRVFLEKKKNEIQTISFPSLPLPKECCQIAAFGRIGRGSI